MNAQARTRLNETVIAAAFRRALSEALAFEGSTTPNPAVGCVILDASGNVLSAQAHQKAGEGHAEARALADCAAQGVTHLIHTAVVTLEPCNHHGRTGPCTQALLATPVEVVWIGTKDPNPKVEGGGASALRNAGIEVHFAEDLPGEDGVELPAQMQRLIAPFAKRMLTGMPFVTVKQALDQTGGMVPPAGQKTFTSEASLELAHGLRRRADAILTGSGTILADNPLFTIRKVEDFRHKTRSLSILDRRGRVPRAYLEAAGARGFRTFVETDLFDALKHLAEHGAMEVLVEAGPKVTDAILSTRLWDEHVQIHHRGNADGTDRVAITSNTTLLA